MGYSEIEVHKHQDGNRSTTDDVEVLWSALGITMSDYDIFSSADLKFYHSDN